MTNTNPVTNNPTTVGLRESSGSSTGRSCAVVVTYKPEITPLLKLLRQLNKETDFIVIDNGTPGSASLVESITVYDRCLKLIRLHDNEGLAKALNRGIAWAVENNYDYVFLFDQDSSLCDLFISRMLSAYVDADQYSKRGLAALGPRVINPQTMRQTPFKLFNRFFLRSNRTFANSKNYFVADFLITSGSLIVLKYIDEIGAMKESYFIDNVDLEWCFRAKSKGFDIVGTDEAVLYHAIGERSMNPLVRAGIMAQHNPSRTYYSSRNRVHLYRVAYSPWGWKLRDIVRFTLKATWLLVSSHDRKLYWHNICSGIRDAKSLS
ncbi:MAG: glycosyltransferase family 2 protein [Pseudohongiella sp.]|nr:glycosyltransferase family 2 protein [Pseudohongiella sp.]